MNKVRIGIIGCGGMGSTHAGYINRGEVPGAELAAVCDIDPKRLEWARQNVNVQIPVFDSAEALFAARVCDAALIATPHYLHPPLAVQAFSNGLHVMSEKPAGVYTKQAREMNEAAAASGRVFGIMFQMRGLNTCRKMQDLVSSGELGELRRNHFIATDWFRAQSYYDMGGWRATWGGEGGGILMNQCPHSLDLWQWVAGMPKRIRAFCQFGKFHAVEVEDAVTAYAEYENGATGVFIATTGEAPGTSIFELAGDRGKLALENGRLTFWRNRVLADRFLRDSPNPFALPECWKCEVPASGGGDHRLVTAAWIKAILEGAPLLARGEEGIRSLEIANAMVLSTWLNDWVSLPIDEDLYYAKLQEKIKTSTFVKKTVKNDAPDFASSFKGA